MALSAREMLRRLTGAASTDLIRQLDEKYDEARKARLPFERIWYTNIAFYFGKQYVQWTGGIAGNYSRMYEPKIPPWRVRLIANRIRPIVRTELAKLTKEKPTGFVMPASNDEDDLLKAQAAEQIWDALWNDIKVPKELRRALFWMGLCGTGFLKDGFDVQKKDASGQPGAITLEPVTPFHLLVPNVEEEEIEKQPYVIHHMVKDPEWIENTYGMVVPADSSPDNGLEGKFLNALGITQQPEKDKVHLKEISIKPCKNYPEGAVIHWAGQTVLWSSVEPVEGQEPADSPWPYGYDEYPFTKFDHIPTGRFYGDSVIPDLIPLQKEYNRTRSQIIESKNRMAKPQLLAPRGSVNPNMITSEPGLIIFYTPGHQPPTPLQMQNLPNYVLQELDRTLMDMDDISGQHEISRGGTPPQVTAATAISFLQEQDESKLAWTIASLEEGVEKIGRHFLSHVQNFWDAQRTIKILGENGQMEAYLFSGADIQGNTDLRVQAGSATPRSKAAKQAFITEIAKLGWIPPDKALKYLDMAETGKMYEELNIDMRQAQRENLKLAAGIEVVVNTYDNHMVHIMEHNNFRKRQKFETLDDEVKGLFEMHVMVHEQNSMMGITPEGPGELGMSGEEGASQDPNMGPEGNAMMPESAQLGGTDAVESGAE